MNNIPLQYWSIFTLILVGITLWMAYRFRSDSIMDGLRKLSGYIVTWLGLVVIILVVFPVSLRIIPLYMSAMWQPVLSQYSNDGMTVAGDAQTVFASSFSKLNETTFSRSGYTQNIPAQPETQPEAVNSTDDVYVVQPGDTFNVIADELGVDRDELAEFNASNIPDPARLEVGDRINIPLQEDQEVNSANHIPVPTIAVTVTNPSDQAPPATQETQIPPTPRPTPTPLPTPSFLVEILEVQELKAAGQPYSAGQILDDVLSQDSSHQEAKQLQEEVIRAKAVIVQWNSLSSFTKEKHELAKTYLSGYSFEIVANESKYLRSLWNETITIKSVTEGWTYGMEFSLPRGHIYHLNNGHDPVGLVFDVE